AVLNRPNARPRLPTPHSNRRFATPKHGEGGVTFPGVSIGRDPRSGREPALRTKGNVTQPGPFDPHAPLQPSLRAARSLRARGPGSGTQYFDTRPHGRARGPGSGTQY